MADTLESVYLNTSIGATELDDGEQTILTTDSTTRFVIKDMYVKDTSSLTNTHLELNGFNVSGITSNATGSLIIPPNSTLKIKTTDYPFSFFKSREWAVTSGDFGYKETFTNQNGTTQGTPFEYYYSGALGYYHDITDVMKTRQNNTTTDFLHYTTNDNNSQQSYYYINTSTNSSAQNDFVNYSPFGLFNGKAYSFRANSNMDEIDLAANPTSGSMSASNFGGQRSNSYSPHSTSSYPRGHAAHGFFFYVPSSGYNDLYAVNLENGCFHKFETGTQQTWTVSSNNGQFVVSIDEANDKMYLYANKGNNTDKIQWVFDNFSSIKALDNTTNPNVHNYSSVTSNSSHTSTGGNHSGSNMSMRTMGYDTSGGFYYKNSSHELVHVDKNFNVVGTNVSSLSVGTQNITNPSYGFVKREEKLTASQASAASLVAPTFGLQLLGIKSTS